MNDLNADKAMPKYICAKQVYAFQIHDTQGNWIMPEEKGYDRFLVPDEYIKKYNPEPGGYYLIFSDGRQSYLPEKIFNEFFTADDAAG